MALLKPADEFEKHQRVERDAAIVVFFLELAVADYLQGLRNFIHWLLFNCDYQMCSVHHLRSYVCVIPGAINRHFLREGLYCLFANFEC